MKGVLVFLYEMEVKESEEELFGKCLAYKVVVGISPIKRKGKLTAKQFRKVYYLQGEKKMGVFS